MVDVSPVVRLSFAFEAMNKRKMNPIVAVWLALGGVAKINCPTLLCF